jgi:hypothetical protein
MPRQGKITQVRKDIREFGFKVAFAYIKNHTRDMQHHHMIFVKETREKTFEDKGVQKSAVATMNRLLDLKDTTSALIAEMRNQMPKDFPWPDLRKVMPKQTLTDVDKP